MNLLLSFLMVVPGAFFAPVIHEWTKARVSNTLGDPVPRNHGFLSGNPFRFFEPIGFVFLMYFNVGWGRPVPVSPLYYKDRRKGVILTYTAPIIANLLVGMLAALIWSFTRVPFFGWALEMRYVNGISWLPEAFFLINDMVIMFARINVGLALFNLVPIHPMAGNKLLQLFVSPDTAARMNHYEKPLQIILFILLILGLLQGLLFPIRDFLLGLVL